MLKDSFCSSPWFHLRLTYNGDFEACRWAQPDSNYDNVSTMSVMQFYNSDTMKKLRSNLLNGESPHECRECYYQDVHGKMSGRRRQLNKSAIDVSNFELTMRSSPHYDMFLHSHDSNGHSEYHPVDLQIDLGNTCNSACIMCHPAASTRLYQDYKKLNKINGGLFELQNEFIPWSRDPDTLDKFVKELVTIPNLKYIHFLGGETLYDQSFYQICDKLIDAGISKDIIVGITTNCTIYDERVENLISQFKEFHLGLSIESVTKLNDYIRYPSEIGDVIGNIRRFLELRKNTNLSVSLRITPNVFSIYHLDSLFEFMIENSVIAESCNILSKPDALRIELIPDDIRKEVSLKLGGLIEKYSLQKSGVVNVRRNDLVTNVIADVIIDYKTFIDTYQVPENVKDLREKLIAFIGGFEVIRKNTILDYLPEYEKFLRRYGY